MSGEIKTIMPLFIVSLILFLFLILSPFISFSPILYVTRSEKAMIYANTALSAISVKNFAEAEKYLKKAMMYDPKNLTYQENLGVALLAQPEKKNLAIETFNKILSKDANNLTSLYYLGSIVQDQSDYEEAKKKFQAYLNVNSQSAEVLTMLGVSYYKSGNKDGAKEQWEKALKIDPNFEAAKNNLMTLQQESQPPQEETMK